MPSGCSDGAPGIGRVEYAKKDIVRHSLVQRIVEAYERHDAMAKDNAEINETKDN